MRGKLFLMSLVLGCGDDPGSSSTESVTGSIGSSGGAEPTTVMSTSSGGSDATVTGQASTTSEEPTSTSSSETTAEPEVHGLRAEYWATYVDLAAERVDATVDFDWGTGSPVDGVAPDRFSIRWTGSIDPPVSGELKIITVTDDGVRMWIDDVLVIDDWHGQFAERNEAPIEVTAGVPVKVRLEYFELDMPALAQLKWSSDTITEEVIPQQHLRAAGAASGLPGPKPPYANPVVPFDCPDPGILQVAEDRFFMVCTGGRFPIRQSRDLILWTDTGVTVLSEDKPPWAANGHRNWAPEIHLVDQQYVAYFTTVNGGDVLCIGAATASDPLGPYTVTGGPLVEDPVGVIDATFVEDQGAPFLVYKIDGNSKGQPTPIYARQLAADGLGFAGDPVQVLINEGNTWEGGVVEAPWMIKRGGYFYLFYSGNVYDHRYRTGVARGTSILGPFEKHGAEILTNNEAWVGPGHGSIVQVNGLDYFVYHAWHNAGDGTQNGDKGRQVLVDRIDYEADWPRIHDGTPSRSPQLWPGVSP